MNIQSTFAPKNASSQIRATETKLASQPRSEAEPNDSVVLTSTPGQVEIFKPKQATLSVKLARHASKVLVGAGDGLLIGLMSNGIGPVGATLSTGIVEGVVGGVSGYKFGKELGQKLESADVESKLKRQFAVSGALDGASDGLMKGGLVAGLTALTGGNLAVGMAAGVALKYLF